MQGGWLVRWLDDGIVGTSLGNVELYCAKEQFDHRSEYHQVQEHLYGNDQTRKVGVAARSPNPMVETWSLGRQRAVVVQLRAERVGREVASVR